ncbi:hypothetical protein [Helicobacter rodentium]|nr:hypothetical protein [Helicobacter rodentium]
MESLKKCSIIDCHDSLQNLAMTKNKTLCYKNNAEFSQAQRKVKFF